MLSIGNKNGTSGAAGILFQRGIISQIGETDSAVTFETLIEFSRRRENLSFGHHANVAALEPPEQDYWLDNAEATVRAEVRSHSEKPEEFYEIIEAMYPYPVGQERRIELFQRKARPGWVGWGNE